MAKDIGKGIKEFKKSLSGEDDEEENDKTAENLTCTKCETKLKPGIKYCPECGKKIALAQANK